MILRSSLGYFSEFELIVTILGLVCVLQVVYCDDNNDPKSRKFYSTSIVSMIPLLETERQLLIGLRNYTLLFGRKQAVIRSAIAEMRAENQKAKNNPEEYLSNPINSYALIRRLHEDWVYWQLYLQSSVGEDEISEIVKLRAETPSNADLSDAVEGLYRLQTFAGLNPADMAAGILNGKQYEARFTVKDCVSIADELFAKDYFNLSGIWLNATLELSQGKSTVNRAKLYAAYSRSLRMENRTAEALEAINNALRTSPHDAMYLRTKHELEYEIQREIKAEVKAEEVEAKFHPTGKYEDSSHRSECYNAHTSSYPSSKLHCIYNRTASPFLHIAPFKMEIINLEPYVVLYHDVIHDAEIATLKEMSTPVLQRAQVFNTIKNDSEISSGRVAHLTSFEDYTNDVTKRLNQRIADMTGFDLTRSYPLQINNYGIGGNFEPHYDYHNTTGLSVEDLIQKSHLSTVLIYMSDVEQGGATVFPRINATVRPQKGSALVWYNLDLEGMPDLDTMHAACPVIVGSKWAIIKMVTEYGQIFKRPHQKIVRKE